MWGDLVLTLGEAFVKQNKQRVCSLEQEMYLAMNRTSEVVEASSSPLLPRVAIPFTCLPG